MKIKFRFVHLSFFVSVKKRRNSKQKKHLFVYVVTFVRHFKTLYTFARMRVNVLKQQQQQKILQLINKQKKKRNFLTFKI